MLNSGSGDGSVDDDDRNEPERRVVKRSAKLAALAERSYHPRRRSDSRI